MRITRPQLRQVIHEEMENEHISIIFEQEKKRIDALHEEMEKDNVLLEIGLADVGHFALDIGGLVPGYGEAADLANAAWYASKGEFLMAALSLISVIPVAGDIVGKGGKLAILLSKGGAKAAKAAPRVAKTLSKYTPQIKKLFKMLSDNPKIGKYMREISLSIRDFIGDVEQNPGSPESVKGLQKVAATKPVTPVTGQKLKKVKQAAMAQTPQRRPSAVMHRQTVQEILKKTRAILKKVRK